MYEKLKKDRECLKCQKFFECAGKPPEVKRCLQIVPRENQNLKKE
jgi:hypothetical protein